MCLIPMDDPEAGRVWIQTESGDVVAELAVSVLGVPAALMLAAQMAAAPEAIAACRKERRSKNRLVKLLKHYAGDDRGPNAAGEPHEVDVAIAAAEDAGRETVRLMKRLDGGGS